MIGRNETASKKARFWQSFVRSLKGKLSAFSREKLYLHRDQYSNYQSLSVCLKHTYLALSNLFHLFVSMLTRYLLTDKDCLTISPNPSTGSEDIRAEERYRPSRRSVFPELLSTSYPYSKSIYDDPIAASERIAVPGYRYLPVHRETYGYSPRAIYTHNYARSLDRYRPGL